MQDAPADDPEETQRLDVDGHDAPTVTPTTAAVRRPAGGAVFQPGHVVANRYRIVRLIARGGMGEVYEAEDLELHDAVALKTIRPEIADDPVTVERFRREIQIARKITHPNVCRVFDVDHDQSSGVDVTFVTMELLAGQTLRELIVERGPLSTDETLPIARQIADGLAAAHRAGVVHRDLKSANVMLVPEAGQEQPRVVVTDFGLAAPWSPTTAPSPTAATSSAAPPTWRPSRSPAARSPRRRTSASSHSLRRQTKSSPSSHPS